MKNHNSETYLTYGEAGVDEPREQKALVKMLPWFRKSFSFRKGLGSPAFSLGHFANVLDMGDGLGLVLTTDGVGTKLMIAQMCNKFDTIGIECVANNVNDLLCLGAEPIAIMDYLAIDVIDEKVLEDIAKGLSIGAEKAHISIPGGEIAQMGDMLARIEGSVALDLVGSAVGVVGLSPDRTDLLPLIDGSKVEPGDAIVGLLSSGLHSNGYSLVRKVLFNQAKLHVNQYVDILGRTLGEELLEPTYLYVDPVLSLLRRQLAIHGMVNISGGGLLSLGRLPAKCSYHIENLPPVPAIFNLIQEYGSLPDTQMFSAFNMGIGFCIVCANDAVDTVIKDIHSNGYQAMMLGSVSDEKGGKLLLQSSR